MTNEEELRALDALVTATLGKYVDPVAMDLAVVKLKKHVRSLADEDLAKPEKVIEEWAKAFVAARPEYAKEK